MTMDGFIDQYYPINQQISMLKNDPIKRVLEQDDLPYDAIMSIDGVLQKVVYVSDDTYVPVVDILSYFPKEVEKMDDLDFKTAYFAYMDNVDVSDIDIETIMSVSREYMQEKSKKAEQLKCIQ